MFEKMKKGMMLMMESEFLVTRDLTTSLAGLSL